ncbi:MAG: hypothetical protein IJW21_06210 [Clostridia bacterium]|nr:hypothetical protein [Clostridia bacterium]
MKAEKILEALGEINEDFVKEAMNYKMKKKCRWKPLLAIAACLAFALTAYPVAKYVGTLTTTQQTHVEKIGVNGEFAVFEGYTGMGASGMGKLNVEHKVEFSINSAGSDFYDELKIDTSKQVQIGGKTIVGQYKNSTASDYYQDDRDNYEAIENGRKIQFSINRETGECTLFFLSKMENESIENRYTRDECFDIAVKYLSNYVDDIENYVLKYEYERMGGFGYFFMLYRTADGIMTSDRVTIGVRENGEVYAHTLHSIGATKNIDVSELDMGKAEAALNSKVNSVYKNTVNLSYNSDNAVLTKLKDGSYVIDYFLLIEAQNEEGGEVIKEECRFIVTIG